MKELFNRVVMQNEEIDSDKAVKDVENVVSQSRNSLHILDMLQCMRRYDDETYVHSLNVLAQQCDWKAGFSIGFKRGFGLPYFIGAAPRYRKDAGAG